MEWRTWIAWWIILYIRYLRFFECIFKKNGEKTINPSIRKYVNNKIKNRITFKIKTGYYLELLTHETMKLLGSMKNKRKTKQMKIVKKYLF